MNTEIEKLEELIESLQERVDEDISDISIERNCEPEDVDESESSWYEDLCKVRKQLDNLKILDCKKLNLL